MRRFRRSPVKRLEKAGDVDGLIALLQSGSTDEREDAANALARFPEAEEALRGLRRRAESLLQLFRASRTPQSG